MTIRCARLKALAEERRRFGYRRLWVLLRREGHTVNRKRIYRLYKEERPRNTTSSARIRRVNSSPGSVLCSEHRTGLSQLRRTHGEVTPSANQLGNKQRPFGTPSVQAIGAEMADQPGARKRGLSGSRGAS